jgi:hypothetical protein
MVSMLHCCTCDKSALPDEDPSAQPTTPYRPRDEFAFAGGDEASAVPLALNMDTAPEGEEIAAPPGSRGEETFKFHMARATRKTNWGVHFVSDSKSSLTIASLEPGKALAECNDLASSYAAKPIRPGDVIVSVDGATTQAAMVEKLKQETSLTAEIVRWSKFDAVIENPSRVSLGMEVIPSDGKLMIGKIELTQNPVKHYNARNYVKPLVAGDMIVAVDSEVSTDEMIRRINNRAVFTLSIERHQQLGQQKYLGGSRSASKEVVPDDAAVEIAKAA